MTVKTISVDKIIDYLGLVFIFFFIKYGVMPQDTQRLILIFSLPFLLWILHKPFVGICLAVLLDLWFSYVDLYAVPPRNYLIFYLTSILILSIFLGQKVRISPKAKKIITIFLFFICWAVTINLVQNVPLELSLYQISGKLIASLLIGICTMYFIKDKYRLKLFLYCMIFAMSISAFVGVMQYFNFDFFWQLREATGVSKTSVVGAQILGRHRIPGLAYFAIPFSYQLGSIIPLFFALLLSKFLPSNERKPLWVAFGIMSCAMIFSLTRSAILGCVLGLCVVYHLSGRRFNIGKITVSSLLLLILLASSDIIANRFLKMDESALARIPQTIVGVKIFLSNPMGVGVGQFQTHSAAYFKEVSHLSGATEILRTSSHNQFLNTAVYYGIPGVFFLLLFYKRIFISLIHLRHSFEDPFLKGITIGLIGSFISYIINSLFHNAGPFVGDPFNWYFIGMVLVLLNLHDKLKAVNS